MRHVIIRFWRTGRTLLMIRRLESLRTAMVDRLDRVGLRVVAAVAGVPGEKRQGCHVGRLKPFLS
jgi:hypothetical protein